MRILNSLGEVAPAYSLRRRSNAECGSGLVEYAIVLTVFLTLLFGIIDFGRLLYAYHFVSASARDASRWAAVNGYTCTADSSCNGIGGMNNGRASYTDIQNYVTSHVPQGIDATRITFPAANAGTIPWTHDANSPDVCSGPVAGLSATALPNYPGCTVVVQVNYAFNFVTPLVGRPMTLSSTSQMVIAH